MLNRLAPVPDQRVGTPTDGGDHERADSVHETAGGGILTPPARAISGLALAVMGLFGQNLPSVGLQALVLGPGGSGDLSLYHVVMGAGSAALALALVLVSSLARGPATAWPAHVARATVVVALVGLVGALLIVLGGLVHGS